MEPEGAARLLQGRPALLALTELLNGHLRMTFPDFYGDSPVHPALPLKKAKIIHDSLWGTNRFTNVELALIDSPLLQRLRGIRQTGLACDVYPGANHTRFEHSLGVVTTASRVFDALAKNSFDTLKDIARSVAPETPYEQWLRATQQELRLAALLHDVGHSLFSHASEPFYAALGPVAQAVTELTAMTGKRKGAGEVLSFCFALTDAVSRMVAKAAASGKPNLASVALILVGRSSHPYLQFLGDIISSALDADKLDYLLRDASAAGLPMRYDFERYLHAVGIRLDELTDGDDKLRSLYSSAGGNEIQHSASKNARGFSFYEAYRLRLPAKAINAVEQIVISKFMLFSYIYHHPKVRAAEGVVGQILSRSVEAWRGAGESDCEILKRFLDLKDSAIEARECLPDGSIAELARRLCLRLLPREVYRFNSSLVQGAPRDLLKTWLIQLQDPDRQKGLIQQTEKQIGTEILIIDSSFAQSWESALEKAGAWLDVPKPPRFEPLEEIVEAKGAEGVPTAGLLPVDNWADAYVAYRYFVRVYAFSECLNLVQQAACNAMQKIVGINDASFYTSCQRQRSDLTA